MIYIRLFLKYKATSLMIIIFIRVLYQAVLVVLVQAILVHAPQEPVLEEEETP